MGPYAQKFKNSRRCEGLTLVALSFAAFAVWATATLATLRWLP